VRDNSVYKIYERSSIRAGIFIKVKLITNFCLTLFNKVMHILIGKALTYLHMFKFTKYNVEDNTVVLFYFINYIYM